MTTRKLTWICLGVSLAYFIIYSAIGAFSFNPGVGEGADLDPASLKFKLGYWLDSNVMPIVVVPYIPYALIRDFLGIQSRFWDLILMPASVFLILWGFCQAFRHACCR